MSATTFTEYTHYWWCADCAEGGGPFDDENSAVAEADSHDAKYHAPEDDAE